MIDIFILNGDQQILGVFKIITGWYPLQPRQAALFGVSTGQFAELEGDNYIYTIDS